MQINKRLTIPEEALADFCRRWRITELAIFGSVLTDQFNEGSDVDVLVTFAPDAQYSFKHLVMMQGELETLFQRPVDLLTKRAVEDNPNPIRRKAILESAQVIYAN